MGTATLKAAPEHQAEVAIDREAVLRAIAPFATLPDPSLAKVAAEFEHAEHAAGTVIFNEGDVGDRLFVIIRGQAELSAAGSVGQVPLATLGPGAMVGELALLTPGAVRNATLAALTPLVEMSLSAECFRALLDAHPPTAAAFARYAENLQVARFIRSVGPFMTLDDASRRWLAGAVSRRQVPAAAEIIRQGEPGDSCFMLRAGRAEVVVADADGERVVAKLGPGALFGEAALLTEAPRSATVRATVPCEVLELHREDLDELAGRHQGQLGHMVQLFRLQERPRRSEGVVVTERTTPDGETLTVLKHPGHLTYYRLSERGRFIWDRLDGYHDMRALTIEFFRAFHQLSPDLVAGIVDGLARTRMIDTANVSGAVGEEIVPPPLGDRILMRARRMLDVQLAVGNLDARITRAYDGGIRWLYTRTAQVALALVAVAGLVAFVLTAGSAHQALSGPHKSLVLLVVPGVIVSVFLHEAAHAFTVKAFGREVNRGGVGWYWFGPMAFVDTSDMWLGTTRQRILVSLAGPYCDLIVAGLASLAGLLVGDEAVKALLWSFALPSYIAVLTNLNPLLEFDGYHVLSDLLDRPNLRSEALGWVGGNVRAILRPPRGHRVDVAYALGSLVYIGGVIVSMFVLYRLSVRGVIAGVLSAPIASALAWVLALGLGALVILGVAADLRPPRPDAPAARR